jgi:hypothetical protein
MDRSQDEEQVAEDEAHPLLAPSKSVTKYEKKRSTLLTVCPFILGGCGWLTTAAARRVGSTWRDVAFSGRMKACVSALARVVLWHLGAPWHLFQAATCAAQAMSCVSGWPTTGWPQTW